MKYPINTANGDAGEFFFAYKIASVLQWPCRLFDIDIGIDAQVEVINEDRSSAGRFVAFQIKSSSVNEKNRWYVSEAQINYWRELDLPVFIVLVDLSLSEMFLHRVDWVANEGESTPVQATDGQTLLAPNIPTKGDVPTIGHGSTRYEDGTPVKITDPPITRERAEQLARNLRSGDERMLQTSLPGVKLCQEEYDLYLDFVGQYGIGTWRKSSTRRHLLNGDYLRACNSLLLYKYAAGFDCSTQGNKQCWGVWERQLERNKKCLDAQ